MFNLIKWKEEVIDNGSNAIHYYDDAILGDIEQLKVMLCIDDSSQDTGNEALDDIFDFWVKYKKRLRMVVEIGLKVN